MRNLDLSNNFLERLDNKTYGLFDDCLSLEKVITLWSRNLLRICKISFFFLDKFESQQNQFRYSEIIFV